MSNELKQTELQEDLNTKHQNEPNIRKDSPIIEQTSIQEDTKDPESNASLDIDSALEETSTLVSLPNTEEDNPKAFAFDINQKIDALQTNIDDLTGGFNKSKGDLANALGDLQSRTAVITGEIESIAAFIEQSDSNKKALISKLEERLGNAVNSLNAELGGVGTQIQSQHSNLSRLQRDLEQSYQAINHKISKLKAETDKQLRALSSENDEQNKTQQVFSEYLDDLNTKTNTNADDIYHINTDLSEHKRLTKTHFRIGAATLAGITLILAGSMTYLSYTSSGDEAFLQQKFDEHNSAMSENYASKANTHSAIQGVNNELSSVSDQTKKLDDQYSQLIAAQGQLSDQHELLSASATSTNESLDKLLSKVSALELSLYGPKDSGSIGQPKLTINDASWIAKQNAEHYVIQLVGVYRERSIIAFTNRYASALKDSPLSTNISQYRGQAWHNLYYGNFVNFSDAQAVLDKLPADIQRNSPWIRKISSIQSN